MSLRKSLLAVSALLSLGALPAAADVYRCSHAKGVTYQEIPCPDSSVGERANIPTIFPEPNVAERERLLEREAALYKRLEARRDREVQEAVLRDAAAERQLERERLAAAQAAAQAQPQYLIAIPAYGGHRRHTPRAPFKRTSAFP